MRENFYTAIVLKKQAFNEADEIITFFTLEAGKIRALAKSIKFTNAKLQSSLQGMFLVNLTLVGQGNLPKIIGAEIVNSFSQLRQESNNIIRAYYACELILKFTPDGQKNSELFFLFKNFLEYLNSLTVDLEMATAKFKISFLNFVGLSPASHQDLIIQPENAVIFNYLTTTDFKNLQKSNINEDISAVQNYLSNFIVQNLERQVNSEKFMV